MPKLGIVRTARACFIILVEDNSWLSVGVSKINLGSMFRMAPFLTSLARGCGNLRITQFRRLLGTTSRMSSLWSECKSAMFNWVAILAASETGFRKRFNGALEISSMVWMSGIRFIRIKFVIEDFSWLIANKLMSSLCAETDDWIDFRVRWSCKALPNCLRAIAEIKDWMSTPLIPPSVLSAFKYFLAMRSGP